MVLFSFGFSLKTNWLKWNPDYDNAAHSFDKAGTNPFYYNIIVTMKSLSQSGLFLYYCVLFTALSYRTGKSFEKAIETLERAADAHYKNNAYPTIIIICYFDPFLCAWFP